MEVPYGRESVDHASTGNGSDGKDVDIRTRNLLLLRCAELEESRERILSGLQQTGREACNEPKPAPQFMKVFIHDFARL